MPLKGVKGFNELINRGLRKVRRLRPVQVTDGKPPPGQVRAQALAAWAGDATCTAHFLPELRARIQVCDNQIDEEFKDHANLIAAIGERKALRKLEALFTKLIKRETS